MANSTFQHIMVGAFAGEVVDLAADPLVAQLTPDKKVPAIVFRDKFGNFMWGLGLGDAITFLTGGAVYAYGAWKKKTSIKETGLGWLGGAALVKLAELGGWLNARSNTWINETPYTVPIKANNLYAGPVTPQPSPYAPPADPQPQLLIGSKAGTGKDIYKPNYSAPPCAGANAASTQLFV